MSQETKLIPSGAVDRGTFQLVQFDPQDHDEPWAVYEDQGGVAALLGEGRTAAEALTDAGHELAIEDGPRGSHR